MPQVTDMTGGVKIPCSTCRVHSVYCFFFSFSFTSYDLRNSWLTYRFAVGLKTLTSLNATEPVNQKPCSQISTLAWSDLFAVFSENVSPLNGCSCGSTRTSLQTSVDKFAVVFWIWLWRKVTNPPFGLRRACCKLNVLQHAHWLRICFDLPPYLINNRSQKLCLFRMYPSFIRRVVSQEDASV